MKANFSLIAKLSLSPETEDENFRSYVLNYFVALWASSLSCKIDAFCLFCLIVLVIYQGGLNVLEFTGLLKISTISLKKN